MLGGLGDVVFQDSIILGGATLTKNKKKKNKKKERKLPALN